MNASPETGVRASKTSNGIAVLSENMPGSRGVAIGVWLGIGSRFDPRGKAGLAHLFEHMVFKGTGRRSALRISRELEEVGGALNAWTSREHTCFYAKVLAEDLPRAVSLLCDLITGARLSDRDLVKERSVILEEIRSGEDDPEELVDDLFAEALWSRQPLGAAITGTLDSVASLTCDDLRAHQERVLGPKVPVCVTAAGAVDHDRLLELIEKSLAAKAVAPDHQKTVIPSRSQQPLVVRHKDISQACMILSRRSLDVNHPNQYALAVINLLLGGGMASRLNQTVREKHGLCYSIYSFFDMLLGTGALGVCLSTAPEQAARALALVRQEILRITEGDFSEKDLAFARQYAKGSTLLALESTSARMQHLGKCQLFYGRPRSRDEIVANIDAVNLDDARRVAAEQFGDPVAATGWSLAAALPEGLSLPWKI